MQLGKKCGELSTCLILSTLRLNICTSTYCVCMHVCLLILIANINKEDCICDWNRIFKRNQEINSNKEIMLTIKTIKIINWNIL